MVGSSVLTIGNYDGLHRGHQAILRHCRSLAEAYEAEVVALPFDPHPARTLRPSAEPPRLMSRGEKEAALKAWGADRVVVLEPTWETLGQSPEAFVAWLVGDFRPVAIVEGSDFRFGKGRKGDMEVLAELGRGYGFEAVVEPAVEVGLSDFWAAPVSSTVVRWLVGRGRVRDAALCLGRHYGLTATVAQGERRGRQIGVPTVNLRMTQLAEHLVPADGVYAGHLELAGEPGRLYPAAMSVGVKPTFGQQHLAVEAYILDFDRDIYGQVVTFHFARWIRDQYAFPGLETLKAELERDIARTRQWHERGQLGVPAPVYLKSRELAQQDSTA